MTVSIVARVVRIPVIAAVVVPMLVAACSNDLMSPRAQSAQLSSSAAVSDGAARNASSGGSVPWFRSQASASSGGSVPWFSFHAVANSGGSVPWF